MAVRYEWSKYDSNLPGPGARSHSGLNGGGPRVSIGGGPRM